MHDVNTTWSTTNGECFVRSFAALCCVLACSCIPLGKPAPPKFKAHFVEPTCGEREDHSIQNAIVDLIDRTPAGGQMRASIYYLAVDPIVDAIREAVCERGVDVRLVVDDRAKEPGKALETYNKLADVFGGPLEDCAARLETSEIKTREPGSIGSHAANNHNKFWLFSEIVANATAKGARHVVAQTSFNPSESQRSKFNDMLVVKGSRALYDGYVDYHTDLRNKIGDLGSGCDNYMNTSPDDCEGRVGWGRNFGHPKFAIAAFHSPSEMAIPGNAQSAPDPVREILDNTDCSGGGTIRLAHSLVKGGRARGVLNRLATLADEGCSVGFVARDKNDDNEFDGLMRDLDRDHENFGAHFLDKVDGKIGHHNKFMIVDAVVQLPENDVVPIRQKIVLTGSTNMKTDSLTGKDETMLRVSKNGLFDKYLEHWNKIRDMAEDGC